MTKYPPNEILSSTLRKNYEFIILVMLKINNSCTWGDLCKKNGSYEGIPNATLSNYLKKLIKKEYVLKERRNTYKITKKGKIKINKLELGEDRKPKFPSKVILGLKNNMINVLFMIIHNKNCHWGDFPINVNKFDELSKYGNPPPVINQKKLSELLKQFENEGFIEERESKKPIYKITEKGYNAYIELLKKYDLDRESRLNEWSNSIKKIKNRIQNFIKKEDITEMEVSFRLLDNYLHIPIRKEDLNVSKDTFLKILLYISWNHPNNYGNFISIEQFSNQFGIDRLTLEYNVREIVENQDPIMFFSLKNRYSDEIYFFRENEKLEKSLRAVLEDCLKMLIYFDLDLNNGIYRILKECCQNLFNENLKYALRPFVREYLQFLEIKFSKKKQILGDTREIQDIKSQLLGLKKYKEDNLKETNEKLQSLQYGALLFLDTFDTSYLNHEKKTQKEEKIEQINIELEERPYDINLYVRKSKILCDDLFQFENALEVVERGLSIDDKEVSLYINKAMILRNQNKYEDALEALKQAYNLDSEIDIVLSKMSYIYYQLSDFNNALDYVEKALKLNPKMPNYFTLKAEILMELNKFKEALEFIDYAIVLDSKDIYSHQLMARAYELLDVYEGALDSIERALELDPEDPYSFQIKAETLELQGNLKIALLSINKAIDLNPTDHCSFQIEARILGTLGKLKSSLKILDDAIELAPDNYYSFQIKAEHLRRLGLFNEASEEIENSLKLNPNDSESLEIKALIHLNLGNDKIALDSITQAIEFGTKNFTNYQIKAEILRNLKRYDDALYVLKKATDLEPESPYNYQIEAQIRFELGQNKEALEIIEKAIIYGSNLVKEQRAISHQIKADILAKLGQYEKAINSNDCAIILDPKNLLNYNNKAYFLAKVGNKKDSIMLIERLIKYDPDEGCFYDTFGDMLFKLKQFRLAIEKYKIALIKFQESKSELPDISEETYIKIGKCYLKMNEQEKAREFLEKGKKLAEKLNNKIWFEKVIKYLRLLD